MAPLFHIGLAESQVKEMIDKKLSTEQIRLGARNAIKDQLSKESIRAEVAAVIEELFKTGGTREVNPKTGRLPWHVVCERMRETIPAGFTRLAVEASRQRVDRELISKVENEASRIILGESFIDQIVERIKKKQIK